MLEFFFHFSAIIVLPFWGMMILAPNWNWTQKIIASPWIIVPPVICYAGIFFPHLSLEYASIFSQPSPVNFAKMAGTDWGASLFWAHAGAFDLFIGRWIFFDSQKRRISHHLIAPILTLSIFFGPIGFLIYWILAAFFKAPNPAGNKASEA